MDAEHAKSRDVNFALVIVSSLGVGLAGKASATFLPVPLGSAADTFFGLLSTGILTSGLGDWLLRPRFLPETFVLRRWLWLSLATGLASIRYLTESGDMGPGKLITCIAIGLAVTIFAVRWISRARREHLSLSSRGASVE